MTEELFRDDAYLKGCDATIVAVDGDGIVLDRTVFYPVGGGQPGDIGTLTLDDGVELIISDTRKSPTHPGIHHITTASLVSALVGRTVRAEINWERRYLLMRVHTCLHLLCSVIPEPVTGGSIRDNGSGRLDFDIPDPRLDKESLTASLNALVAANRSVVTRWITDEELAGQPELVRTMSVKPPSGQGAVRLLEIDNTDLQPCGGTHVRTTGEIGVVTVKKIEKKGRQNRRVTVALVPASS
jgi:misacylated tRNA(Ala) deacylase